VERMVDRLRIPALIWTASALQLGCNACSDELSAGDPSRPDIVLISVDTLRADHLSSHGYSRQTSPFFDSLANDGVRFDFAHSASPWTLPSHTTMFTGQLPMTHKVVEDTLMLSSSTPVLPELLQGQGYATGGFVATYYVSSLFGFNRGFDVFDDFGITEKTNLKGEVVAEDVVDEALDFYSDQEAGQAVFLFIHLYDVHYSYDPPAPYETLFDRAPENSDTTYKNYFHFKKKMPSDAQMEHQIAQYDESIRYVNDQLERIQTAATEAGREVRFVVTADHGEEFGERGSWGHAHTLYAEQLHIPLIFSGGGLPSGVVSSAAVGTHDIAPTIAAWAGVEASLQPDGSDLASVMEGGRLPERVLTSETTRFETNRLGIYSSGLRLEWDLKANTEELFDPHADPLEQTDLSGARPGDLLALEKKLLAALGTPWEATQAGTVSAAHIRIKKGKKTSVPGAILVDRGAQGPRRSKKLKVEAGDRFAVLPYDAELSFTPDSGQIQGPWQAEGGSRPGEGDPLRLHSEGGGTGQSSLDDSQQEALEALGYIQE
jgi:arylsulfatase A-like enzyme